MTARLIGRIAAQPWAMHEGALQTVLEIAGRETLDATVIAEWKSHMAPQALRARPAQPLANADRAGMRDGVAILPISGPIFRYANIFTDMSGATSLASFAQDLQTALADQRVRAVILEVDSPGGEQTGLVEAAAQIRAAASVKPVVAYVEGLAASAAYQLAAAASEVVCSPTAMLGCLGVVGVVTDRRAADARGGVVRHEFVSSQTPNKRPDPATDAGRAAIQANIDALGAAFLDDVAAYRAMTTQELLTATDGGGLVVGAAAVARGLADRLGGFEDTIARLAAGDVPAFRRPTPAPRAHQKEGLMTEATEQGNAAGNAADSADAAAGTTAAVALQPLTPGAALLQIDPGAIIAERSRCAGIQAAALPGFTKLGAQAIDEGWTVEQFIRAQANCTEAVEVARNQAAGATFRDSLNSAVAGSNGDAPDTSKLPPAERASAEFAADPKIKAEFGDVATYESFLRAEAAGKIRVLGRKG